MKIPEKGWFKVYKIQNQAGKFSTGGTLPQWSDIGKVWGDFNSLKRHLRIVHERYLYTEDTYVVEYMLDVREVSPLRVDEVRRHIWAGNI